MGGTTGDDGTSRSSHTRSDPSSHRLAGVAGSSIILRAMQPTDELARFRVDDKVAVVSGGTGAIGSRLALALARSGAKVGILGRTAEQATELRDEIASLRSEAYLANADVTKTEDVNRALDEV